MPAFRRSRQSPMASSWTISQKQQTRTMDVTSEVAPFRARMRMEISRMVRYSRGAGRLTGV